MEEDVVGRNKKLCSIVISRENDSVSGVHLKIQKFGKDEYFIVDLDSTNGTEVGDGEGWQRIDPGVPMRVSPDFPLRLGMEFETSVGKLLGEENEAVPAPDELEIALKERRWEDARKWLNEFESWPGSINVILAQRVLSILRAANWFREMETMASMFRSRGANYPEVRRQLAQAMIEQGNISSGIDELKQLEDELARQSQTDPFILDEYGETLGLLGRAYKQLYLNAAPISIEPRTYDYEQASKFYFEAFNKRVGDYRWSGVNYVAMQSHSKRVGSGDPKATLSGEKAMLACKILDDIDKREAEKGDLTFWDYANQIECFLALGKDRPAIVATRKFLDSPSLDAFAVRSTLHQLSELWMLTEDESPGDEILPMIKARFLEMGKGTKFGEKPQEVTLTEKEVKRLEKVWGDTQYHSIGWILTLFDRSKSVLRLGKSKFEGMGTAFVFDGSWLGPQWTKKNLILTNAHVCSPEHEVQRKHQSLPPEITRATFLGNKEFERFGGMKVRPVWTSPPEDLDATLLELVALDRGLPLIPLGHPPVLEGENSRVNILGHPRGAGEIKVSIQDNEVFDLEEKVLLYRTPTDPGSSGSPVFDKDWNLVALHHASAGGANRGIRMDVLLERIKGDLSTQSNVSSHPPSVGVPGPETEVSSPDRLRIKESELQSLLNDPAVGEETLTRYFNAVPTGPFSFRYQLKEEVEIDPSDEEESLKFEGAARGLFGKSLVGTANGVFGMTRLWNYHKLKRERPDAPTLVSEGDSWFQHPYLKETISQLGDNYNIRSLGAAGDELSNMLSQKQYLGAIYDEGPVGFLFSGLGNDILGQFTHRLNPYFPDDGSGPRRLLNTNRGVASSFSNQLEKGLKGYDELSREIAKHFPALPIFVHGYDYAIPGEGKRDFWLKPALDEQGIPDEEREEVVRIVIDKINQGLQRLAEKFANLHYVDCRGAAPHHPVPWDDAIHPHEEGYREVANRFHLKIQSVI